MGAIITGKPPFTQSGRLGRVSVPEGGFSRAGWLDRFTLKYEYKLWAP